MKIKQDTKKVQTLSQFLPKYEPKNPLIKEEDLPLKNQTENKQDKKLKNKKILLNVSLNYKNEIQEKLNNSLNLTPEKKKKKSLETLNFLDPLILEKFEEPDQETLENNKINELSYKIYQSTANTVTEYKKDKETREEDVDLLERGNTNSVMRKSTPVKIQNYMTQENRKENNKTGNNIVKIAKKYNIKYQNNKRSSTIVKNESNIEFLNSMKSKEMEIKEIGKSFELEKDEISKNKKDEDISIKKLELENVNFLLEEQIINLKSEIERLNNKLKKSSFSDSILEKINNLLVVVKKALPSFNFFSFDSSYKSIENWLESLTKKNKTLTNLLKSSVQNKIIKQSFIFEKFFILRKPSFLINPLEQSYNDYSKTNESFTSKRSSIIKTNLKSFLDEKKLQLKNEEEKKLNFKKKKENNINYNSKQLTKSIALTPKNDVVGKNDEIDSLHFDVELLKKELTFIKNLLKKNNIN